MTPREAIYRGIERGAEAAGENVPTPSLLEGVEAQLREAGLVILPATPSVRLRHEATKGTTGFTPASFNAMWDNLVAYARTLER